MVTPNVERLGVDARRLGAAWAPFLTNGHLASVRQPSSVNDHSRSLRTHEILGRAHDKT
jgi:hypothetical protein